METELRPSQSPHRLPISWETVSLTVGVDVVRTESSACDQAQHHLMRSIMSLLLLWSAVESLGAERIKFQSGTNRAALVELYTSEGCSSCPPAEEWLSQLKIDPRLWMDFVPVAFHVDYWVYLGWRDPFGTGSFSERQRAYAAG